MSDNKPERQSSYSRPSAQFTDSGELHIRASAASDCRRKLWYYATGWDESDPTGPEVLTLMAAGNALEPVVVDAMRRNDWTLTPWDADTEGAVSLSIGDYTTIVGHPDAVGHPPSDRESQEDLIVEIKTRGPGPFGRWKTLGAERSHPEAVVQAAVYTYGYFQELREAVIATMNTGTRLWDPDDFEFIPADRVASTLIRLRTRIGGLEAHYEEYGADPEALPDRDYPPGSLQCMRCPFLATCGNALPEPVEEDAPEDEEVTQGEAARAARLYKAARKRIKADEAIAQESKLVVHRWMEQEGHEKTEIEGDEQSYRVSIFPSTKRSVNLKKLNFHLPPEVREEIVTETKTQQIRIT